MNDEYGDPEADVDAAILDDALRELLNDIAPENPLPPADTISAIRDAIDKGWPDGSPPSAEDLPSEYSADVVDPTDDFGLSDHWSDTSVEHGHHDFTHDGGGDQDHDAG